jgi:hypothetical protein|tara:strand:- start:90 stop:1361 length:1272 start_codon:yes stop_codon:yes gene_type:complete
MTKQKIMLLLILPLLISVAVALPTPDISYYNYDSFYCTDSSGNVKYDAASFYLCECGDTLVGNGSGSVQGRPAAQAGIPATLCSDNFVIARSEIANISFTLSNSDKFMRFEETNLTTVALTNSTVSDFSVIRDSKAKDLFLLENTLTGGVSIRGASRLTIAQNQFEDFAEFVGTNINLELNEFSGQTTITSNNLQTQLIYNNNFTAETFIYGSWMELKNNRFDDILYVIDASQVDLDSNTIAGETRYSGDNFYIANNEFLKLKFVELSSSTTSSQSGLVNNTIDTLDFSDTWLNQHSSLDFLLNTIKSVKLDFDWPESNTALFSNINWAPQDQELDIENSDCWKLQVNNGTAEIVNICPEAEEPTIEAAAPEDETFESPPASEESTGLITTVKESSNTLTFVLIGVGAIIAVFILFLLLRRRN